MGKQAKKAATTAQKTPTTKVATKTPAPVTAAPVAPAAPVAAAPVAPSVPLYSTTGAPKVASFKAGHNQAMWLGISTALAAAPNGLTVAQIQAITTPNMGFANYCIKKCGVLVAQ